MRVLHVITGLGLGGAERQLFEHATRSRHHVEVAALYNVGEIGTALRTHGVAVHDLGMRSSRDLTVLPRLVRVIRRGQYDVVHVHLYRACVYGRVAARWAGVQRVITTEHSLGTHLFEGRRAHAGVRVLYRATASMSDFTIAVSPAVRDRLMAWGVAAEKIVLIPNGIDLAGLEPDPWRRMSARRDLGVSEDERVVGTVGRLVASKRHDLVVRAFALSSNVSRLVIAGDGPERRAICRLAHRLGIRDRVHLVGARPAEALLDAFDVFVSAATPGEETFGLAPVEARANGLPCVVTYCPALEGHTDARTIRSAPDAEALAVALSTASGLGRGAPPSFLDEFAIDHVVAQIDDVYTRPTMHETRAIARKG